MRDILHQLFDHIQANCAPKEHIAALVGQAQGTVQAGPPHVGIDQQHPRAAVRERHALRVTELRQLFDEVPAFGQQLEILVVVLRTRIAALSVVQLRRAFARRPEIGLRERR